MANALVKIDLGGGETALVPGGSGAAGLQSVLDNWAVIFPQWEIWVVKVAHGNGIYTVRDHDGSNTMSKVRSIAQEPAQFPVGASVMVGFYKSKRSRPFILAFGGSASELPTIIIDRFAAWWRYGVRMAYRFFQPLWDDPEEADSSITLDTPSGLTGTGSHIRTDAAGVVYWVDGDNLNTLDIVAEGPTGTPTVTDLGGEITSLCLGELSGRSYCTVQEYVEAGAADYDNGYAAAVALLTPGSAWPEAYPFTQGATNCTNEDGYLAADLIAFFLAGDYAPDPGESADWQEGWVDGFTAFYTSEYNDGYESEGCTVP